MLTSTKERIEDMVDQAQKMSLIDDSKAFLKLGDKDGKEINIVLKASEKVKDNFIFGVFKKVGCNWACIESDYHSNINKIQVYLINKYIRRKEGYT